MDFYNFLYEAYLMEIDSGNTDQKPMKSIKDYRIRECDKVYNKINDLKRRTNRENKKDEKNNDFFTKIGKEMHKRNLDTDSAYNLVNAKERHNRRHPDRKIKESTIDFI